MRSSRGQARLPFRSVIALRGLVLALLVGVAVLAVYWLRRDERRAAALRANVPTPDPTSCPHTEAEPLGAIVSEELDEVSGMVASRNQPGVLWVHNDSGDEARVFAVDARGELRAEVALRGVKARDFEDITLQPRADGPDLLFVGDIGDNLVRRDEVRILRFAEPVLPREGPTVRLTREPDVLHVRYDDGAHDAETLLADPRSGDLYIVTKAHLLLRDGEVGVYRLPADELHQRELVARRIATLFIGPATAGDIARDGSMVAIRNYWRVYWWRLGQQESLADALARSPCLLRSQDAGGQGESLTFLPDGSGYMTVTEGEHPPLVRYPLRF